MQRKMINAAAILVAVLCAATCNPVFSPLEMDRAASKPEFLQIAPLRSVYSQGETFTSGTGIGVYRSTAAGNLEPVPLSAWTSVTITPDGGTKENVLSSPYQFTDLGNHTVEVKALGMTGTYDLWVAAGQPVMDIAYVDGATGKMKQNAKGEWEVTGTPRGEVIYSFTTVNVPTGDPGWTYYMGRPDNDSTPIKLNISPTGRLEFRPPSAQGGTPVGTVAEMQLINTVYGALADNYYQEADIDLLGGANIDTTAQNPQTGRPMEKLQWKPIGKTAPSSNPAGDPFTGTFDGNNKSLDNIYVNETSDGAGLFGYLNGSAVLQNIRLASGSITGAGKHIGGIAGGQRMTSGQTVRIIDCFNGAAVSGVSNSSGSRIGGIIGRLDGGAVVTGCRNEGEVKNGIFAIGGIAGSADANTTIIGCGNSGDVSGGSAVGGIIGIPSADSLVIIGCRNEGDVSSPGSFVGGITGGNNNSYAITACYNLGKVEGANAVGGITGAQAGKNITACYNDGSVSSITGSNEKGGILGDGSASPAACYWNIAATGTQATHGTGSNSLLTPSDFGTTKYLITPGSGFPNVKEFHIDGNPNSLADSHGDPYQDCPEWGPGVGAAWDGTGSPPTGGWWKQDTIAGGTYPNGDPRLPRLWWE